LEMTDGGLRQPPAPPAGIFAKMMGAHRLG
jgi:hypothetical protein